jgi:hypothetical protein
VFQQHLPLVFFICRNPCCGHNIHHRGQTVFQQHLTLLFFIVRNLYRRCMLRGLTLGFSRCPN